METQTHNFDLVIVGSGGGGLTAALAAKDAGLSAVILEKQDVVGGSTSMSGGIIWVPNNPLMREDGIADSTEAGLTYLTSVVGEPDDGGSSLERRTAFIERGSDTITFLRDQGLQLVRCDGYADYYDNVPGGHAIGRAMEGKPWNGKKLGAWHTRINPGMMRGLNLSVMTNEVRNLAPAFRTFGTFVKSARIVLRTKISRLFGKDLLTNGMSLVGQLTKLVLDRDIPIWLGTEVQELIVTDGRVVGVRAVRDGKPIVVTGDAVLLAAGGFERNGEMRLKYNANTQHNDGERTVANQGNTGTMLQAAIGLGARIQNMDEAVWNPLPRWEILTSNVAIARQYPHTIFVNQQGRRFVNESNSYVEVVKAMYANDAIPAWLVFDDAFRKTYPWGRGMPKLTKLASILPGRLPKEWVDEGWIRRADTLEQLAGIIDVDAANLAQTVATFNQHAEKGLDPEFHRGESQYNKVLGDPGHKPNPSVGPLSKGPYYATEIYAGDVGTTGGVVTDKFARVLDEKNEPIAGLYATGNMASTVVGATYPGAGASIAHTMTFGYVAAHHVADNRTTNGA